MTWGPGRTGRPPPADSRGRGPMSKLRVPSHFWEGFYVQDLGVDDSLRLLCNFPFYPPDFCTPHFHCIRFYYDLVIFLWIKATERKTESFLGYAISAFRDELELPAVFFLPTKYDGKCFTNYCWAQKRAQKYFCGEKQASYGKTPNHQVSR